MTRLMDYLHTLELKSRTVTALGLRPRLRRRKHSAPRQLLIDVTIIARTDYQTGIQRVVRAQVRQLVSKPPDGFIVRAVRLMPGPNGWRFHYADSWQAALNVKAPEGSDGPVRIGRGDFLFLSDFAPVEVTAATAERLFARLRARGVSVLVQVHDLLPLLHPEYFPAGNLNLHRAWLASAASFADILVCTSNAVADDVRTWLQANPPGGEAPTVAVAHIGGAISESAPTSGRQPTTDKFLKELASRPTFLMVGTVEPRKGHLQAIAAVDAVRELGHDINLAIVGREAWVHSAPDDRRTVPIIVATIRKHPELNTRLFWFNDATDEELEEIYGVSNCLVYASEGEGFGLPLIEATAHGIPIVCRDLPVFREVLGDGGALYFSGLAPDDLACALIQWLEDRASESPTPPLVVPTWRENRDRLVALLGSNAVD